MKATERGVLTPWRQQREGQVTIWKDVSRERDTHILETAEGGTGQETERMRPSEGHSLSGDRIGTEKSGHNKKATKRGVLTP